MNTELPLFGKELRELSVWGYIWELESHGRGSVLPTLETFSTVTNSSLTT